MSTHIMIDLETLGTRPGAALLSLGAVLIRENKIVSEFYELIDPQSCVEHGMRIEADTVRWWMKQSEAARDALTRQSGEPVAFVLQQFKHWKGFHPRAKIWGNGASFDNALLAEAYHLCGMSKAWDFWNDRCYRTLKNLYPAVPEPIREGTHHNALDDARHQARHLINLLESMKSEAAK